MKNIVIQGLGYVGLAMMTFCAGAKKKNKYLYNVVGIEKNSAKGLKILDKINSNKIPKIVDDKFFFNFYSKLIRDNRIKVSINDSSIQKLMWFLCFQFAIIILKKVMLS